MSRRQIVQIPVEQVKKLSEIDNIRKDLAGYPISKKVHILLQEKLKEVFLAKEVTDTSSDDDWYEYIRNVLPTYIIGSAALGSVKYSKEMIGKPYTQFLIANEGDKTWWCNYSTDIENIGKFLLEKFKDKAFTKEYFTKYHQIINNFLNRSENLRKEDFTKLSEEEFLKMYTKFNEDFGRLWGLTMDIDCIDIYLEKKIKDKLIKLLKIKNKQPNNKYFNSRYSILTAPIEPSYINVEETAVLKLVKKIKETKHNLLFKNSNKIIKEQLKNKYPKIEKKIRGLAKKFWWTSLGWTQRKENDFETYITRIRNNLKTNKEIEKKIRQTSQLFKKAKKARAQLSKEYKFDAEMNFYLMIFDKYVLFHDLRKETQMKGISIMNKFLIDLARRKGINYDDIIWAWPFEVENYIKSGTIDFEKIRSRKGAFFTIVKKDSILQFSGEQAIVRRKKALAAEIEAVKDFSGIAVSLGKVSGSVKICHSSSEALKKIKKGDILVASMTLPDYVIAMKKAAAIITDEGGITCHAAIVSRELNIPCLVGTKIATKVLKDNDLVEVNANHGVVKIIKKI